MSLLVGLPLKLFHILFMALRLAWPVLLVLLVWLLIRRHKRRSGEQQDAPKQRGHQEPKFNGPVYTVDYEEVDSDNEEG